MDLMMTMYERAYARKRRIVLPEGNDERICAAAKQLRDEGLAGEVIVLQDGFKENSRYSDFSELYYAIRKHKGVTVEEARQQVCDPLYWGALMVRSGSADVMVAGATHATADVLRAAFHVIGTAEGTKTASSYFIMHSPESTMGYNGYFLFADCAIIPVPSTAQLADIGISTADSFRKLFSSQPDAAPQVAMLSFSTHGSADHEHAAKIAEATALIRTMRPSLQVDGELQFDAAIVPSVAQEKSPDSVLAGRANICIFPDLSAGNIGYKIAQRLGGFKAFGPFIQGMAKPVSDLSRGCTVQDIVNTAVVLMGSILEEE